jgi:hypothetical protein
MVETKAQRAALEAAYELMSEEETRLGITHAGFALTSLPHRRIADRIWRREGHMTTLLIESGSDREGQPIGVPYGSVARLILLYLQSEAVRTRSPEVELGKSMRSWMARMGMSIGGRTYNVVGEQATKLSSCRLTFFTGPVGEVGEARHNGSFVRDSISLSGVADAKQESLWQPRVRLDERFYESLMRHPVPVREEAIRAIGTRSMAIDIYVWLAYRLHSLTKTTPITWLSLFNQFGGGCKSVRQMKPHFLESLEIALAVYPEARLEVDRKKMVLHPSPPAVPKIQVQGISIPAA